MRSGESASKDLACEAISPLRIPHGAILVEVWEASHTVTKQSRMLAYYKRGIMRLTEHLDAKGEECTTENVEAWL